jgi:hypothetical protein
MAIALDSTAFESTINIVCVSFGGPCCRTESVADQKLAAPQRNWGGILSVAVWSPDGDGNALDVEIVDYH